MPTKNDLGAALLRLDAAVKSGDAAVGKSLRKGASAAALSKLAKKVGGIPPEMEVLLRWHDGQSEGNAIGSSTNERLMPISEMIAEHAFLEGKALAPWKASWLPIMSNGAGDHVVYDRANGRLVRYYHDDEDRPKAAPSLAAWALEVAKGWEGASASVKPVAAPAGWTAAAIPTAKVIAKLPDGTAYYFRATEKAFGKGVFFHLFWKQKKDVWFQHTSTMLEHCWLGMSNNLFPFRATPDRGMTYCLSKEKVFIDGEGAAHAGLFTQTLKKPPFPPKK
ncbi:hypothetical protein BH09MYX1_BH09MYX1_02990 [soil metagenome]